MPRTRAAFAWVALSGIASALVSCGGGSWGGSEPTPRNNDLRPDYNAFAPDAIRIHPLTHIIPESPDGPILVCHTEFTDRWGDAVKALGRLQVQLYRVEAGLDAGTAQQMLRWEVRLEDERYNASVYDTATRTYRIELIGLPAWMGEAAAAGGAPVRIQIRATLQTLGPSGEERVLSDDLTLDL